MGFWSRIASRIPLRLLASGTPAAGKVPTATSATRVEWQTPSASGGPATQIQESSGPTTLTIGAIADGEFAKRVGTTLVGAAAGGGGNGVDVVVSFGSSFTEYATKVVTGEAWVTATSKIVVTPSATAAEAQDVLLHGFTFAISDRVVGDGFTLHVWAAREAKGTYTFHCIGV